jgi:hypothetical protein
MNKYLTLNCQNATKAHGRKSTLDALREFIRVHRNAKAFSE